MWQGLLKRVGKDVTRFQAGDEVFGWRTSGVLAEYACVEQGNLAPKPANLSFEQAAAVTVSGTTALQALRDKGEVQLGQKVLIVGASGGVGTFAVQIAKSLGAEVTGVCSTRNVDMVRSIGADHVIDYTKEDFTQSGQRYDVILDSVETHSLSECRRALASKGTYIPINGAGGRWVGPLGRIAKAKISHCSSVRGCAPSFQGRTPRTVPSQGAHRIRKDHTRHRQDVPAIRERSSSRSCRTGARSRKSRRHRVRRDHDTGAWVARESN